MQTIAILMGSLTKKSLMLLFLIMWFSAQQLYAGYPSMVLEGTNVKELHGYIFSCLEPKAGNYEAETGGAELRLEIRKKGKTFQVHRHYCEPGITPQTKVYDNFQRNKAGIFQTKGARLRVANDGGILFLELSSGLNAITASMWTYFGPREAKGSPPETTQR